MRLGHQCTPLAARRLPRKCEEQQAAQSATPSPGHRGVSQLDIDKPSLKPSSTADLKATFHRDLQVIKRRLAARSDMQTRSAVARLVPDTRLAAPTCTSVLDTCSATSARMLGGIATVEWLNRMPGSADVDGQRPDALADTHTAERPKTSKTPHQVGNPERRSRQPAPTPASTTGPESHHRSSNRPCSDGLPAHVSEHGVRAKRSSVFTSGKHHRPEHVSDNMTGRGDASRSSGHASGDATSRPALKPKSGHARTRRAGRMVRHPSGADSAHRRNTRCGAHAQRHDGARRDMSDAASRRSVSGHADRLLKLPMGQRLAARGARSIDPAGPHRRTPLPTGTNGQRGGSNHWAGEHAS